MAAVGATLATKPMAGNWNRPSKDEESLQARHLTLKTPLQSFEEKVSMISHISIQEGRYSQHG